MSGNNRHGCPRETASHAIGHAITQIADGRGKTPTRTRDITDLLRFDTFEIGVHAKRALDRQTRLRLSDTVAAESFVRTDGAAEGPWNDPLMHKRCRAPYEATDEVAVADVGLPADHVVLHGEPVRGGQDARACRDHNCRVSARVDVPSGVAFQASSGENGT